MKRVSLGEYKSFLYKVCELVPELRKVNIEVVKGDQFSVENVAGTFYINIPEEINSNIYRYTQEYFGNRFNQAIYLFKVDFIDYFIFLHEIGHIITRNLYNANEVQQHYNNIKNTVYDNQYEAFKAHRQLYFEKLADNFAVDFTNKYFYEIVKYFNPKETNETIKDILEICLQ